MSNHRSINTTPVSLWTGYTTTLTDAKVEEIKGWFVAAQRDAVCSDNYQYDLGQANAYENVLRLLHSDETVEHDSFWYYPDGSRFGYTWSPVRLLAKIKSSLEAARRQREAGAEYNTLIGYLADLEGMFWNYPEGFKAGRVTEMLRQMSLDSNPDVVTWVKSIMRQVSVVTEVTGTMQVPERVAVWVPPADESHPCTHDGCTNKVAYDDEPWCFTHSPDSGSNVTGYSYKVAKAHEEATGEVAF